MPYANVVGRSRRSPATPVMTARRSASIWPVNAKPGVRARPCTGPVRPVRRLRHREVDRGPAPVGPNPVRRVGGSRVRAVVSKPDPQHPGPRSAAGRARPAGPPPIARTRSSSIGQEMKPSGTGWNCPIHPKSWGWGKNAHLLVGSLAHSGKWRAVLSPWTDQPHLVAALDRVARGWWGEPGVAVRPDGHGLRPWLGRVTASFAGVAKHYGVSVAICPARRGNRKGVVEKINHTAAQRWWRTLADDITVEAAQADVDRFARVRASLSRVCRYPGHVHGGDRGCRRGGRWCRRRQPRGRPQWS